MGEGVVKSPCASEFVHALLCFDTDGVARNIEGMQVRDRVTALG
jgi:hypothetical protein